MITRQTKLYLVVMPVAPVADCTLSRVLYPKQRCLKGDLTHAAKPPFAV